MYNESNELFANVLLNNSSKDKSDDIKIGKVSRNFLSTPIVNTRLAAFIFQLYYVIVHNVLCVFYSKSYTSICH